MKKRRGFTLVELIAVIIIVGIIAIIALPAITKVFGDSKDKTSESKIVEIETAGYEYGSLIKDKIYEDREENNSCKSLSINELINKGFILSENKSRNEIIDPKTNESYKGVVCLCYNFENHDIEVKYFDNIISSSECRKELGLSNSN